MRTSVLSLGTITYIHTKFFSRPCHHLQTLLRNHTDFSIFHLYQLMDLASRAPKFFSQKTLRGPPYGVGETSCILIPFFHAQFHIYGCLFGNHINPSIFCVYQPIDLVPGAPSFFPKKIIRIFELILEKSFILVLLFSSSDSHIQALNI